jgi:aarF domain-containing kinase
MSFEEGKPITDKKYIKENKICIKEAGKNLADIFNTQIFKHGFVHSDPHPGNILLRNEKDFNGKNKLKIVLLDHGLYRHLEDDFRFNYINIWRGIINQNKEVLKIACNNIGIDKVELFMSILCSKTYDDIMDESTKYNTEVRLREGSKIFRN